MSVIPPGRKKSVALSAATKNKLSWPKLQKTWERNAELAEAAQLSAHNTIAEADSRAADRVEARLLRDGTQTAADALKSKPEAILPSAITQEAQTMANHHVDPDDRLGFLTAPPPPRPPGRLDDTALVAQTNADRERERAVSGAQVEQEIHNELKTKSKKQLELLRQALSHEMSVDQAEAIEQLLARFLRLVVRWLTLGGVSLPATPSEQRRVAAERGVALVDAEIQRRADVEVRHPAASQPPRVPRTQPALEKFQILRAHDPRRPSPDRDEVAREQDAQRERNRK